MKYYIKQKKREEPDTIARPAFRGSGMPISVERATQKPHAEYVIRHHTTHHVPYGEKYTYPKASTVATILTEMKFTRFRKAKKERK